MNETKKFWGSPMTWIPTLYFAQGIPYFIVNNNRVTVNILIGV